MLGRWATAKLAAENEGEAAQGGLGSDEPSAFLSSLVGSAVHWQVAQLKHAIQPSACCMLHVVCVLHVLCFMCVLRVASCTVGRMLQYGATWQVLQPVLAHVGLERCAVHAHTRKHTRARVRAPMRTRVHCRCADSSYSTGSAIKLQTVDFLASVGIKARTD